MNLLEHLNISSGKVIPGEKLALLKGGDRPQGLPGDCGDQTEYTCPYSVCSGCGVFYDSVCADSSSEATQMVEDMYPDYTVAECY